MCRFTLAVGIKIIWYSLKDMAPIENPSQKSGIWYWESSIGDDVSAEALTGFGTWYLVFGILCCNYVFIDSLHTDESLKSNCLHGMHAILARAPRDTPPLKILYVQKSSRRTTAWPMARF